MAKDYETSRRNYEEYDPADEEPSWIETTKRHRAKYAGKPTGRPKGPLLDPIACTCGKQFRFNSPALKVHNKHYPALCKRRG